MFLKLIITIFLLFRAAKNAKLIAIYLTLSLRKLKKIHEILMYIAPRTVDITKFVDRIRL